jgi:hypothetical protein
VFFDMLNSPALRARAVAVVESICRAAIDRMRCESTTV